MTSSAGRITCLRVRGFRCLRDEQSLDLQGLTVLIGDNGSGKSSVIEACEVLRYLVTPNGAVSELLASHPSLISAGRNGFEMAVRIEGGGLDLDYRFGVERSINALAVASEDLEILPKSGDAKRIVVIARERTHARIFDHGQAKLVRSGADPNRLLLASYGALPRREGELAEEQQALQMVVDALNAIEVHVPFEVMPVWAAKQTGRRSATRESSFLQPALRLELLARNLANVFARLKNELGGEHWRETMDYIRLGLGDDVDDVTIKADPAGGQHALAVWYKSLGDDVPAAGLSDGTLVYLAFVAILRLPSRRSLLAFDEPELHLHPDLLTRVIGMLEAVGRTAPVIIATHSDRVLDVITDPARSVVLCELSEQRSTQFVRPDGAMLTRWLKKFRGFGELRGAGLESAVMEVREKKE